MTIRKWQSIDGKELVVLRGHTNRVNSICLTHDERHLVSASLDYSVRIWDLNTNEQIGDPLLHDDELLAIAIATDGRYIASAGLDKNIYVWSLEAALKQSGDRVHVRAYIAVVSITSNWPCTMATHSPTGSWRHTHIHLKISLTSRPYLTGKPTVNA
ncbi:WD40 repeat-like protein [Rhizopogon salebrosus TDB-379]|nr:WD40 repeat-like protein [Rhizopogon salebrosus TDB-379]